MTNLHERLVLMTLTSRANRVCGFLQRVDWFLVSLCLHVKRFHGHLHVHAHTQAHKHKHENSPNPFISTEVNGQILIHLHLELFTALFSKT